MICSFPLYLVFTYNSIVSWSRQPFLLLFSKSSFSFNILEFMPLCYFSSWTHTLHPMHPKQVGMLWRFASGRLFLRQCRSNGLHTPAVTEGEAARHYSKTHFSQEKKMKAGKLGCISKNDSTSGFLAWFPDMHRSVPDSRTVRLSAQIIL